MLKRRIQKRTQLITEIKKAIKEEREETIRIMAETERAINARLDFKYDHLEKAETADKMISTLGKKISSLEIKLKSKNEFIEKQFEIIDLLVKLSQNENEKLKEKITELKKQVPVRLKATKPTRQTMGIKSGSKTSSIIKKVKEEI